MTVPLDEAVPAMDPPPPPPRRARSAGDPVKALLHRHRELCEHAVDPLEIAAGLEAHGITDRTAARFRHRDVFSLAEELYARTPRDGTPPAPPAGIPVHAKAVRGFGYALLPGALALGAAAAGVPWAGALAVLVTVAALGRPGRAAGGRFPVAVYLLAAAALGWAVHRYGTPLGTALAVAVAPGYLAGAVFAARARRRLAGSRALEDFADGVRPLLLGTLALYAAAAAGAAALAGTTLAVAVPLAVLLLLTRLLLRHGAPRGALAAALALVLALLPVPAAPFAAAAGVLVPAVLALSRASAHAQRP
ncbi:hypothetical protein OG898_05760 [Streptomyces sp. NBC_00193]|uniref:hypothetical protein n=1 Tax=unclassified Streptomyces TaxID=2593676 RepID=UPI00224E25AA|nr:MULTISPECIES: hypothetical protein [unclassified Streptomyces]MCX5122638.1 hypothetical protein [Streptomyces sp. NBC_00347]MCX5295994.1 hypothetical protein [Streptomyces sp. NBC_00193]